MKTTLRLAMVVFLAFLAGCVFDGSGRLETRSFALTDFDSIETNMVVSLDVVRGDAFAVSVTADDNLWTRMNVSQQGKTLHIELPSDRFYSGVTAHATVTMPVLAGIRASGSSYAKFSGFDASTLTLDASGNSTIEGDATVEKLSLDVSGNSHATLTGVRAAAADVSLSGTSSGSLTVVRTLDYDVSGGSHLVYFGNPQIGKSETSGGSSVERH
jgi:ribosomal protein L31